MLIYVDMYCNFIANVVLYDLKILKNTEEVSFD